MTTTPSVFKPAIAPFFDTSAIPLAAPGFQRCSHVSPPPKRGDQCFDFDLNGVSMVCHIAYEAPCRGSRERGVQMEPDEPESCEVRAVYIRDVDIAPMLRDQQIEAITEAFLSQDRSDY